MSPSENRGKYFHFLERSNLSYVRYVLPHRSLSNHCFWWTLGIYLMTSLSCYLKQWQPCFNSLGPGGAIWRWRSVSTLVQVMACCLTAPSHYLKQCWLIISKVLWHSSEDIIIRRFADTNQWSKIEDYIFKITLRSPRGQWVKIYIKVFRGDNESITSSVN